MIQLLHLARENDARKRELARIQEEANLLRHLLGLVLQFRAKSAIDTGVRRVVADTERPMHDGEARYRTAKGHIQVQCRRREVRILVVEDDSAFLEVMVGVVQRVGHLADSGADGPEGRQRVLGRSLTHPPARLGSHPYCGGATFAH